MHAASSSRTTARKTSVALGGDTIVRTAVAGRSSPAGERRPTTRGGRVLLAACLVGALAALAAPAALTRAAEPRQDAEGPEALAEMALDQLGKAIKDHDLDALEESINDLDAVYAKVEPKTLKKIVKALASVLTVEARHQDTFEGPTPQEELLTSYQLVIGVLYDKPEGRDVLVGALKAKHVKAWPEVAALILEGLGFRADPGDIKLFVSYLQHEAPAVASAAAGALGQFAESEHDVRKQVAKELIGAYVAAGQAAEKERRKGKDETAQEYLVLVEGAFNKSLVALTRQRFGDPGSWQAWFDEHGAGDDW